MRLFKHVHSDAVRTVVGLFGTRRRQWARQIFVATPALDPEWAVPAAGFVARQLKLPNLVRWNLTIGLFALNLLRFCHWSCVLLVQRAWPVNRNRIFKPGRII